MQLNAEHFRSKILFHHSQPVATTRYLPYQLATKAIDVNF